MRAFILFVSLLGVIMADTSDLQLKFVQIVTRHGARAAFDDIPNNAAVWNCHLDELSISASDLSSSVPGVLYRKTYIKGRMHLQGDCAQGQLTVAGWKNHLTLGKAFRKRYVDELQFLPNDLNTSLIYVRSTGTIKDVRHPLILTDSPRTISSVQANLLGLYPTSHRPSNPIIDIYRVETMMEDILPSTDCGTLMNACYDIQNSDKWKAKEASMSDLETKLKTAWNTSTLPWWIGIWDNLYSRKFHGIEFPPGIDRDTADQLEQWALWQLKELYSRDVVKSLGVGRFTRELIDVFDQVMASQTGDLRYIHYSAHDLTVALLLSTFESLNSIKKWPKYACSLQFELYQNKTDGGYHVQMLYNREILDIPGCGPLCPYEKFKRMASLSIPDDYASQCKSQTIQNPTDINTVDFVSPGPLAVRLQCGTFYVQISRTIAPFPHCITPYTPPSLCTHQMYKEKSVDNQSFRTTTQFYYPTAAHRMTVKRARDEPPKWLSYHAQLSLQWKNAPTIPRSDPSLPCNILEQRERLQTIAEEPEETTCT
ncbi:acid phosphatase 6, lysophosphatidic [Planoprotostelium fungivorum]|nr:acid phosphatase 6, lysophosphatidic [Planoprotostelium fungivorum]